MADTRVVIVKCVACGAKRSIKPGEIPAGEVPMCEKCFSPMVPIEAHVEFNEALYEISSDFGLHPFPDVHYPRPYEPYY